MNNLAKHVSNCKHHECFPGFVRIGDQEQLARKLENALGGDSKSYIIYIYTYIPSAYMHVSAFTPHQCSFVCA